jgi:hypothetical protein
MNGSFGATAWLWISVPAFGVYVGDLALSVRFAIAGGVFVHYQFIGGSDAPCDAPDPHLLFRYLT